MFNQNQVIKKKPYTIHLLFIGLVIFFIWAAWLIWQDSAITRQFIKNESTIDSIQDIKSLPFLVISPLREVLQKGERSVDADNIFLVAVAEEYQKRRPLDPRGWLWSSTFNQRNGNEKAAINDLAIAYTLSKNNSFLLPKVFNRYLALGLIDEAMPVARDLVWSDPSKFRKTFYLLTRLNLNYLEVIKKVIPQSVPNHRDYPEDIYFRSALLDAVRSKNIALAAEIWKATPLDLKRNSKFGLLYVNFLVKNQSIEKVQSAWQELTGAQLRLNVINFPESVLGDGKFIPCWESRESKSVSWELDDRSISKRQSIKIEFMGEDNIHYSHLSCVVMVESGEDYQLKGVWKGESITTLSGPYVDIYAPGVKGFYNKSDSMLGSWGWSDFEVDFTVPENVNFIKLRIRRNKTNSLDSKISGKVWFDQFELVKKVFNKNEIDSGPSE